MEMNKSNGMMSTWMMQMTHNSGNSERRKKVKNDQNRRRVQVGYSHFCLVVCLKNQKRLRILKRKAVDKDQSKNHLSSKEGNHHLVEITKAVNLNYHSEL